MSEFTKELILIIIKDLGFALLILLASYQTNKVIERYRSNLELKREIVKRRISIIAPLWKSVNEIHYLVTHKLNFRGLLNNEQEIEQIKNEISKKEKEVIQKIRTEEFWFGRILFNKINDYLINLGNLNYELQNWQKDISNILHQKNEQPNDKKNSIVNLDETIQKLEKAKDKATASFLNIEDVIGILKE